MIQKKWLISKGGYAKNVTTWKPQANSPRWVGLAEVFSDLLDSQVKINMSWANRIEHDVENGYKML